MYAVAGTALGRADALPVVERIGSWWLWVAVLAWCVAAIVMVAGWVRRRPAAEREAAPAG